MSRAAFLSGVLLSFLFHANLAIAHGGQPSLLTLEVSGKQVRAVVRIPWALAVLDIPEAAAVAANVPGAAPSSARAALTRLVADGTRIERGGELCAARWEAARPDHSGYIRVGGQLDCPGDGDIEVAADYFLARHPDHRIMVSISGLADREQVFILLPGHTRIGGLRPAEPVWRALLRFTWSGITHILGGIDHVAFVVALLLTAAPQWRKLVFAVSGFTLAHTLALLLATIGSVRVSTLDVEQLIALSIAYVAYEAGAQRRWAAPLLIGAHAILLLASASGILAARIELVAGLLVFSLGYALALRKPWKAAQALQAALFPFIFGLAHGLGFAGPLLEMRLRGWSLAMALLGFNFGVECGQILVIAVCLTVARSARRLLGARQRLGLRFAGIAAISAAAVAWFIVRSMP